MKPILLALAAAVLTAGWSLCAQDGTPRDKAPPARVTGKVLILTNERAFEGDIEKVGELYRVRKSAGEIVVAASQVLHLCADWDDAVAFMRSRANLDDPDERIRLAKWCQVNHQIERALAEAQIAMQLRPKSSEAKQLVKLLEVTPTGKNSRIGADTALPPVPHIDLSFESVTAYTLKIQPILMNTCVNCHSGTYHGKFRLYRLHEGGERVATQRNLAAVLNQVSLDKPAASPLLVMAVCAHGDAKTSPIPGRQSPVFQMLCGWLDQTIADNPHLRERAMTIPARLPTSVSKAPALAAPDAVPPPIVVSTTPKAGPAAPVVETPPDEFSAVHFNRAFHPDRK
jgi:hypothetical protein